MKQSFKIRIPALVLAVLLVVGMIPAQALALQTDAIDYVAHDDYYNVISKDDYVLAPGILESEIVLNNETSTHRQVAHVVEIDVSNPYTKVMPSYMGMAEGLESQEYGVQIMSQQAAYAEANGYGNVVAAMNLSLSWYTGTYYNENPELIGEPLGYLVMDGVYYENSQGPTSGAQTCLVINFDEKDGVARPDDIAKTEIRSTSDPITGWEEQVIPANFGFLVKDGVNQYSENHSSDAASRSFVGIKADGTIIMVMNDGRQSPYSAGFNSYEMAEFMLSLGCVQAVNGDGGGSSAFLSQRPGEELELHCSPSDGSERPTTHGILVISTAPATGEFVRAQITAPGKYFTPNSTVQFTAVGADLVGTAAEIPEDACWQLSDTSLGTIDQNGLFVSNGTTGTVSAQIVYQDEIVGECEINIVVPDSIQFSQSTLTVPYGKTTSFTVSAKYGLYDVVTTDADFTVKLSAEDMGVLNGYELTATEDTSVTGGTVIAALTHDASVTEEMTVVFGKASEVFYDFEEGFGDEWSVEFVQRRKWYVKKMSDPGYGDFNNIIYDYAVTKETGVVHDGNGAGAVYADTMLATLNWGGAAMYWVGDTVTYENVKSIGAWVYIPEDAVAYAVRFILWGVKDGETTVIDQYPITYGDALYLEESGWHYCSVDVSEFDSIILGQCPTFEEMTSSNYNSGFRIEFTCQLNGGNSGEYDWQTATGIRGVNTFYIDNIIIDYSDACDDKEAPIFGDVTYVASGIDEGVVLNNQRQTATVSTENNVGFSVTVAEDTTAVNATGLDASTAKAYIDGNEVECIFNGSVMAIANTELTNGVHTVKFTICDNAGNYSSVIRKINIQGTGADATVKVVPRDDSEQVFTGSQYWIDIVAENAELIDEVTVTLNLDNASTWLLEHIETLNGFTTTYVEAPSAENIVHLTIKRTGNVEATGEQVLASVPAQTWQWIEENYPGYYPPSAGDSDLNGNGMYDPYEFWQEYVTHNVDVTVDPLAGKATFIDGTTEWFSGDVIKADTEQVIGAWWGKITAAQKEEFFGSKSSYHLHTAGTATDQATTCTEAGYTGRVFCAGCACVTKDELGHDCDSANGCGAVLDWGTTIPATGHSFDTSVDGLHTCEDCGNVYYYVDGVAQTGWIELDGSTYYFAASGKAVNGETVVAGVTYVFEDYALTAPALINDGVALVGYWAGEQLEGGWHTLNGKQYHVVGIYVSTGVSKVAISTNVGWKLYAFDENGAWMESYNGLLTYDGETYYVEGGICVYAGLVQDAEGNYYYINSTLKAVKDRTYTIGEAKTNGLLPAGTYAFGADGKMIVEGAEEPEEPEEPAVKNGLYTDEDGEIRYYVDGVATYAGLVQDADGNYYYINSTKKAVKNCTYGIGASRTNGLLPAGTYAFGADGKMIVEGAEEPEEPEEPAVKNGLYTDEDGEIRYYVDGVATYAGLVQDADGNYYYINSTKKAVKNCTYGIGASRTNGLLPAGTYVFGADGKMIVEGAEEPEEPEEPEVKNGLYTDEDGEIRYYVDGVATYAGLVQDADGNYYYINSTKKAVKSCTYGIGASRTNGLLPAGTYEFGADGKMILE